MSDEADELAKSLSKALTGVGVIAQGVFYAASVIPIAYSLIFAYGWVVAHPKQVLLITACVIFHVANNWGK